MRAILLLVSLAGGCAAQPRAPDAPQARPPSTEVPPSEAWRREAPLSGPVDPGRAPPAFETEVLPNGLRLMFRRVEGLPVASIRLVTIGGSATDPFGEAGLTFLTYAAIRDSSAPLERLGVELAMDVDRDHGSIEVWGLSAMTSGVIPVLAEMVIRPRLDPKSIAARKERHGKQLGARAGGPLSTAGDRLPGLLFRQHPYGHPSHGKVDSLVRIDPASVARHHAALLRPERSALIVVGDVSRSELQPVIVQHFGAWTAKGAAIEIVIPEAKPASREDVLLVHRDNVSQAFVCVGRAVPGANSPEEVPLLLLNQVLGGSFNSRLQRLLRETKGWTYSAHGTFTPLRGAGELLACTQVERVRAAEALRALLDELARMRSEPPGDDEIRRATLELISSLHGRESVSAISAMGAYDFARERGGGHLVRMERELRALAPEIVRDAARKFFDPGQFQVIVVADARGLREEIEGLGLGTVALTR